MAHRALLSFISIAIAIGVFAYSASAFTGPAANPPTGDGKIKIDASGNLYTATGTYIGFGEVPDATTDLNTASTTNRPLFKIKGNFITYGRLVSVGQIWARAFIGYDGEAVGESGNIKADGTVAGASLSGAISASYVSGGVFGSSATKGNYTFQAAATTTPVLFVDATNKRVGIGTATPDSNLQVYSSSSPEIKITNPTWSPSQKTALSFHHGSTLGAGTGGEAVIESNLPGGDDVDLLFKTWSGGSSHDTMFLDGDGNVGIGTTSPARLLHLSGTAIGMRIEDASAGSSPFIEFINDAQTWEIGNRGAFSDSFYIYGAADFRLVVDTAGKVGIATTTPAYTLDVWGTARFTQPVVVGTPTGSTHATTKGYVDSAITGGQAATSTTALACDGDATCEVKAISVVAGGSANITGVNKLTVSVIDPIYSIAGTRYATYVSGMTGLKEETSGTLQLTDNCPIENIKCATIDFDTIPSGSDLWLFYEVADFGNDWEDLSILLTPAFNGISWYEKNQKENTIMVYGAVQDANYEVSYRMTAPRFDHAKWPNLADPNDPSEGLFIR